MVVFPLPLFMFVTFSSYAQPQTPAMLPSKGSCTQESVIPIATNHNCYPNFLHTSVSVTKYQIRYMNIRHITSYMPHTSCRSIHVRVTSYGVMWGGETLGRRQLCRTSSRTFCYYTAVLAPEILKLH